MEVTVITTVEITKVYKDVPECFENDKKAYGKAMKDKVKSITDADDVVVTNVQEFEMEE